MIQFIFIRRNKILLIILEFLLNKQEKERERERERVFLFII
jgi:hypothetical protein